MKKIGKVLMSAAVAGALIFGIAGCANDSSSNNLGLVFAGQSGTTSGSATLQQKISSLKSGQTLTLNGSMSFIDGAEIKINVANVTIDGGDSQFDMKNAKIGVNAKGVTLKNLKNIAKVTAGSKIGTGDFTMQNCAVKSFIVNGGGANSVHVSGEVKALNMNFAGARLVLESGAQVAAVAVNKKCKLDSSDASANIKNVNIAKTAGKVVLAGKTSISSIVSNGTAKVAVASAEIKVSKAAKKGDNGSYEKCSMERDDDFTGDLPDFEDLTEAELNELMGEIGDLDFELDADAEVLEGEEEDDEELTEILFEDINSGVVGKLPEGPGLINALSENDIFAGKKLTKNTEESICFINKEELYMYCTMYPTMDISNGTVFFYNNGCSYRISEDKIFIVPLESAPNDFDKAYNSQADKALYKTFANNPHLSNYKDTDYYYSYLLLSYMKLYQRYVYNYKMSEDGTSCKLNFTNSDFSNLLELYKLNENFTFIAEDENTVFVRSNIILDKSETYIIYKVTGDTIYATRTYQKTNSVAYSTDDIEVKYVLSKDENGRPFITCNCNEKEYKLWRDDLVSTFSVSNFSIQDEIKKLMPQI